MRNNTRPRVFSVESHFKHDVSDATRHGDVIVLLPDTRLGDPWLPDFEKSLLDACERHGFDPDIDMLLCAGPSMSMFIAASAITAKYGRIRGLFWNGLRRQLDPRDIDITERRKVS